MPVFTYKAKDRKGELITGTLDADTRGAVSNRLQSMGYFPVDISGGGDEGGAGAKLKQLGKQRAARVRSADLSHFYRQMSDLIGAGVPLVKSLGIVRSQTEHAGLQTILGQVSADVQGGDTFAGALDNHPQTFTKLTVALVRAGEAGGLLDQSLIRISDYAESQEEIKSKLKSAMAYPVIMLLFGTVAIIVLLTYVMPKVLDIFAELGQTLPAITAFLIDITNFLRDYWHALIIGGVLAGFGFRRFIKTDRGEHQFHLFLLKLPKFGDLLLKREIAAFTRTLGSLLRNGVPILNALSISSEVMTIRPIRAEIEKIPESITQGSGMAPSLRSSPLFPPIVVNMVAIGEETGQLPDILLRVADSYEVQVERAIKTVTSIIEPIIILVLGLIVGFIVIAMLLPVFSIDPTAGM